jgi:hypothetical protein
MAATVLMLCPPAAAGTLTVTPTAGHTGNNGLEVTVGSGCTSADDLVLENQTVTGVSVFEGCSSITAGNGFTVEGSGDATLTAGEVIGLGNGFSVASGASFTADIERSLPRFAYVQDDSPDTEVSYDVEFYVDLDAFALGSGDELEHLVAYSGDCTAQVRLVIRAGPVLVLEVRDDTGITHTATGVALTAGWNKVTMSWQASASANVALTVNDGAPEQVTEVDTGAGRIEYVRWGAVAGILASSSGTIAQDDFVSWR